jgi:hypothetical protein
MRRTRNRYFTIDAENEEEYIKEYENITKSRLSKLNFEENNDDNKIQEMDDEEGLSSRKLKNSFNSNESEEGEYFGLGPLKDLDDDEEDNLGQLYEDDDLIKESEDSLIKKDNNEEKGIEILCYYLKNSVNEQSKGKISKNCETIFYNNKNCIRALSGNAIYDLNIRDLVDNILTENDNEYTKSNDGNNNSLRDYIFQNIESDSNLKIMIMSNNKSTKKSFINKFFGANNNTDKNNDEILDEPFEIRKKQIKLFNKNITLQIFDTSDEFHKSSLSYIYYKTVSAFFIFIEASNHNAKSYLEYIYEKMNKYIMNKTCVIFGINMLFKDDCTIDGYNLREYASEKNMMFIPIKINDFDLKNSLIKNLFNLILIKGIDNKSSKESLMKGNKDKRLRGYKKKLTNKINDSSNRKNIYDITKMNIPSSLGYKKKYRIKHINAFDMEDNDRTNKKRKLSADI